MTGIAPARALHRIVEDSSPIVEAADLTQARAEQVLKVDDLHIALDELHKDVQNRADAYRKREAAARFRKRNVVVPKFTVGDFVLVRNATNSGHKCAVKWHGPCRITEVKSDLVYVVEPLNAGRAETVHCTRILPYRSCYDGAEVPKTMLDLSDRIQSRYEIFDSLLDIDRAAKDRTWSNISELHEGVPDLLVEFLRTTSKQALGRDAAKQLGISI